ncbi:hypothetical protein MLD38_025252 [Melastoma candidum]|uniref:Uncharacterized protein n=1 Tax=Melastoma candidum TaxID=119954 RepID=A0ACB9NW61_9MYRT|nr:hypothetical protein MLD38_025252 [Melastoma candidum]
MERRNGDEHKPCIGSPVGRFGDGRSCPSSEASDEGLPRHARYVWGAFPAVVSVPFFCVRPLCHGDHELFPSVTAFRYLVAAAGLQCLWSLSLAIMDAYALLIACSADKWTYEITSTLTFAAACASAGITVLIDSDLGNCGQNHCTQFEAATALAFASWFVALPSFLFNYWSLAIR